MARYLVLITTTLDGYGKLKEMVKDKLSDNPSYRESNLLDTPDDEIISERNDYVILKWNWKKWHDNYPDVNAIEKSLDELEELEIPYKYHKIYEEYSDIVDSKESDDLGILPEIYTEVKFTYEYFGVEG